MTKYITPKERALARIVTPAEIPSSEVIEKVLLQGDLKSLDTQQRLNYYRSVCDSLGLNPLTKPFDYMTLDGKLVLYARKDCTEQLRKIYGISVAILSREKSDNIFTVVAQAKLPNGRTDEAIGAVPLIVANRDGKEYELRPTGVANAVMKAETKAKRRVTLSICGLGIMDESEIADFTPSEYDQRPASEVAERNVREATAHAIGTAVESEQKKGADEVTVIQERDGEALVNGIPVGVYGPKVVTKDNYKERIAHIGKAEGRIVGRKVGELEPPVIKWMWEKWRSSLSPLSSDDDLQLKKAIEFAYDDLSSNVEKAPTDTNPRRGNVDSGNGVPESGSSAPPAHSDVGAKQAAVTDLLGRFENLVLTEEVAMKYMIQFGLANEGWTKLDQMPENLLLYLCTPQGWGTWKEHYELAVKPKVSAAIPAKRGRKKK